MAEVLASGEDHIEDAGRASDGTPLFAAYRGARIGDEGRTARETLGRDQAALRHLSQAELADR